MTASKTGPEFEARRKAVGTKMRELRKRAGLTQAATAARAGLTRQFYLAVEGGQRTLSLDNLFAVADALGADPRDLLTPPHPQDSRFPGSAVPSRTAGA